MMEPMADHGAIVLGPNYRFTVLTDRLIRYEWSEDGYFEDRASTFAIRRNLPVPEYRVVECDQGLEILTERVHLIYDKKKFSPGGLTAYISGKNLGGGTPWRYGEEYHSNLGGTVRTLDTIDGRTDMGNGIMSKGGYASLDDSTSILFGDDGFFAPRRPGERVDGYLFAFGRDYRDALRAFYAVSGKQPTIPRWAFGNWWSRYYKYTQREYLELMDQFSKKGIPLSVAVIDMDWHLVDEEEVTHVGWTGYTWNKNLFPDPVEFGQELHRRNLKVTLNDHPHAGIYNFEDAYEEIAKILGHDVSERNPIYFEPTDPFFLNAYFNVLHRNLEKIACDFWWIDWQQGNHSKLPGMDPLWVLNHFQYLDTKKTTGDSIVFSRYAGPGSHRYPIGFSGDTCISWESLDFQPEFTATASNVGYGWWSHDIGGHQLGGKDEELLIRWVQLGVLSPIMRLHSSCSLWNSKEPWLYSHETEKIMTEFMRLRHKLVPYLFTNNVSGSEKDWPLIQPMYWEYAYDDEAYTVPNQFLFGSELIVAPITSRRNSSTKLAKVKVWLPPNKRFVDIFSGTAYDGNRYAEMFRPLSQLPVLAGEGSIITLDSSNVPENGCATPEGFDLYVVIGRNAESEIIEGHASRVKQIASFSYNQSEGSLNSEVHGRNWTFKFLCVDQIPPSFKVSVNGKDVTSQTTTSVQNEPLALAVHIPQLEPLGISKVSVHLGNDPQICVIDPSEKIKAMLHAFEVEYKIKDDIWGVLSNGEPLTSQVSELLSQNVDGEILNPILELALADKRYTAMTMGT